MSDSEQDRQPRVIALGVLCAAISYFVALLMTGLPHG